MSVVDERVVDVEGGTASDGEITSAQDQHVTGGVDVQVENLQDAVIVERHARRAALQRVSTKIPRVATLKQDVVVDLKAQRRRVAVEYDVVEAAGIEDRVVGRSRHGAAPLVGVSKVAISANPIGRHGRRQQPAAADGQHDEENPKVS